MSDNSIEIPVVVTYYTDSRIICQKEFGSFAHFGSILSYFDRNIKKSDSIQLKSKYFYKNKEIDENDLLINIIQPLSKSKRIISANLSIEVEEKNNISDKRKPIYSQILQPKLNPFGIYTFKPNKNNISFQQYPKNIEGQYELDKFNENSAYCNSPKELFISGGIYNLKEISNFWIINNDDIFSIKKFNLKYPKSNHSMIYIEHKNNEFIFFAGGHDLKTFYYDINEDKFTIWGDMNFYHFRPALIQIENYLYCFDTSFKNEVTFERTDLDDDRHKWEKIIPNYENGKISNFTNSGFGVTLVGGGRIIFCGGDNVNLYTYLYDIKKNIIYVNDKSEDILFSLSDKNFYKINKNYSVALSSSLDELKEVLVVDKIKNTLKTINLNGIEDSKKNKFNYNNIDIDNSSQNKLYGNVDIVFKAEDIKDINDNMIDYKSESDFIYDNNFYFEKKYESNSISEEISEKFRNTQSNLTGTYDYINNNDNFTNYKKERRNIYNLISNSYSENDESYNNVKRSRYKNNKKSHKIFKTNNNPIVDDDEFLDAEGNNFIYDSNVNKYKDSKDLSNYSLNNNKRTKVEYKPNINKYENNIKNINENGNNAFNIDNNKDQEKKEEIEPEKNIIIDNNNNFNYNEEHIIGNNEGFNQGYEEQNDESQNELINEQNNEELNKNNENQNYEEENMEQNNVIENDNLNDNKQHSEENIIIQNEQFNIENKEEKENNNDEDNQVNVQEASEEEIDLNKLKDQNNNEQQYEDKNENNEEQYEQQNENNEEQYEDQNENNEEQYKEQNENNEEQYEEHHEEQDGQQNKEQNVPENGEQYDHNEEPKDELYEEHNEEQSDNQNENVEEEECEEESEENEDNEDNDNNEEQNEEHTQNDGKENGENSEDGAFEESNEDNNNEENDGEDGDFEEDDEDNQEENVEEEENNKKNQENSNEEDNKEGEEEEYKNGMEEEQEQEQAQEQNSDENIEDENLNDKEDNYEHQERDKFEQTIIQSLGEDIIQIDSHPNLYYFDKNNFCDYLHEVEEMTL